VPSVIDWANALPSLLLFIPRDHNCTALKDSAAMWLTCPLIRGKTPARVRDTSLPACQAPPAAVQSLTWIGCRIVSNSNLISRQDLESITFIFLLFLGSPLQAPVSSSLDILMRWARRTASKKKRWEINAKSMRQRRRASLDVWNKSSNNQKKTSGLWLGSHKEEHQEEDYAATITRRRWARKLAALSINKLKWNRRLWKNLNI